MPTEKSGQHEFDFEQGDDFAAAIEKFDPTFTKVLVRHNPAGDAALNARQTARLKRLSDYCKSHGRLFMFELLVPAEAAQLKQVGGDKHRYDLELRPKLMVEAMHQMQDGGVEPDVWKIEGLDRSDDCQKVVTAARRGHREHVGCIVLGRGEDEKRVVTWLRVAAGVPGFIGFAVGRSTFLQSIVDLRAKRIPREKAIEQVSAKFCEWVSVFEGARKTPA
jgi:myo-inositol catabolism protein IolC